MPNVSMRVPSPFRDRRASVELQLTHMIDCVFLLMIYFLWSSSFAVAERSLPSKMTAQPGGSGSGQPNEPPPPEADFENVVIGIAWRGDHSDWKINDAPIGSLAELRQTLSTVARINRDAP